MHIALRERNDHPGFLKGFEYGEAEIATEKFSLAFSDGERSALEALMKQFEFAIEEFEGDLPPLKELTESSVWQRVVSAAKDALDSSEMRSG